MSKYTVAKIVASLGCLLTWAAVAAPVTTTRRPCSAEASDNAVCAEMVALYESLADLPLLDQREQAWALTSDTRTWLWKYNIDSYLRHHPELSADERSVFAEGKALVMTPGWFSTIPASHEDDRKIERLDAFKSRAAEILAPHVIYEVFLRLGPEPNQSSLAVRASGRDGSTEQLIGPGRPVLPRVEAGESCTCASWYDCWFLGMGCADSYCDTVRHCGFFNDEMCWGRCKYGA